MTIQEAIEANLHPWYIEEMIEAGEIIAQENDRLNQVMNALKRIADNV